MTTTPPASRATPAGGSTAPPKTPTNGRSAPETLEAIVDLLEVTYRVEIADVDRKRLDAVLRDAAASTDGTGPDLIAYLLQLHDYVASFRGQARDILTRASGRDEKNARGRALAVMRDILQPSNAPLPTPARAQGRSSGGISWTPSRMLDDLIAGLRGARHMDLDAAISEARARIEKNLDEFERIANRR